ncbi:MAG TPA: class I SAM-dependent methyltransferase [Candidatus Krumholzibacteria bacterium]
MTRLILALNRVFRRPNVGGRESQQAYSEWEHHWGKEFARLYMEPAGDLGGKHLLDVGCGLGGKTVAYAEAGARVVGTDLLEKYVEQSGVYAAAKGARANFFVGDAAALPLGAGAFDTVVANDAMEHFAEPAEALREMARVVRPGGAIWIFFTPHYSPLGSHLYDYVYTPWCHLLFTRGQLRSAIHAVLEERTAGATQDEIERRVREIMEEYDRELNHMSVSKFLGIVRRVREVRISKLELKPARFTFLKPLTYVPGLRELVSGFVVCRLERV